MGIADLGKAAANAIAVALPSIAPATIPAWGPSAVDLFGVNIPIASVALSMLGLAMARGVSSAREGPTPGGHYLTGVLVMILLGLVLERQPGPGVAIAWGIGIGASGIVLYDILRNRVIAMFGKQTVEKTRGKREPDA